MGAIPYPCQKDFVSTIGFDFFMGHTVNSETNGEALDLDFFCWNKHPLSNVKFLNQTFLNETLLNEKLLNETFSIRN